MSADVRYALRLLRARPSYAAMAALTVALGIGAVTTLASVAYGVLLRPLPWSDVDRLVRVTETRGGKEARLPGTILNGTYLAWAESPQTIEAIGAYSEVMMTLTGAGDATRITVASATPSALTMLNIRPLRGRLFGPDDGRTGTPPAVILSQGLWEQRLGGRDDVIGQPLTLDGTLHTIVGVLPREFRFPSSDVRAWVPRDIPVVDGPNGMKTGTIVRAIARLKPGVTLAQAAAEATARAVAAPDAGPIAMALFGAKGPIQMSVRDATDAATADVRPAIVILLFGSVLLLVTALFNVANMQLARTTARHRELTIRGALGAGTTRLARQLLIENAIVGLLGATGGLLLTYGLHSVLPAVLPAGFPRIDAIAIDSRILLATLLLSLVTTLTCGTLPLLYVHRLDIARTLANGSTGSAGAGHSPPAVMRAVIAGGQVAVTCVLVVGAMLLVRSFVAHMEADRGYDSSNLLTAAIPFPTDYTIERRRQTLDRLLERLEVLPGVSHAAISTALPLASAGGFSVFNFASSLKGGANVDVETIRRVVTPGYFGALGIRVRAGRPLTTADDTSAPIAVVVNRTFVTRYLDDVPLERALGVSLGTGAVQLNNPREATIVGVVDDLKQDRPDGAPQAELFVALGQQPGVNLGPQAFALLRTVGDPADHVEWLRTIVREEAPTIALDAILTMDQRIDTSLSRPRAYAALLGGFAVFALLIAGTGLFGVLSHSVTLRSREFAVRTALGAGPLTIIRVAVMHLSVAMIAGMAIGLAASAALAGRLSPYIYGVSVRDWVSFGAAPLALMVVGVIACTAPVRRVGRTDPVEALRDI